LQVQGLHWQPRCVSSLAAWTCCSVRWETETIEILLLSKSGLKAY